MSTPGSEEAREGRSRAPSPTRGVAAMVVTSFVALGASATLSMLIATGVLPLGQDAAIDRRVRDYILANPETILETVSKLDARLKAAEVDELAVVLRERHHEIVNDPASPVAGNALGDATLVEFFDYNCIVCRRASTMLDELERSDTGLRLVFKEFPILGPGSVFAARAALASRRQDKYLPFHKAMMTYKGSIAESSVLTLASEVGIDIERLKKDMEDPAIEEAIKRNLALAEALRITGTPTFVAGKEIQRGLADLEIMKRLIASARQK